jgi:exodeoxyribonuclease V alpha subunit
VADAVRAAIPHDAYTIHRALGGGASGRFRHDAGNPLPADVVLVDEVSMVDLALLYRLTIAIRPQARLILQGDKDQLASVEAGAILGDIYEPHAAAAWSREFAAEVQQLTGQALPGERAERGLGDCLVSLDESYRYRADSGIGRLARAINGGDGAGALAILRSNGSRELELERDAELIEPQPGLASDLAELERRAVQGYAPFIEARDPREKLAMLSGYRVLCAHRQGPRGVEQQNRNVEEWLARAGLIDPLGTFYENRPIIVTQNDYTLGLFNGDVGVLVRDEHERLRVCFEGADGLRFLAPGRLPPHETVFATTVHKSQGSEFDAVSVVLPDSVSALVGRELLYTAVTRARRRVDLFAPADVIRSAIARTVQRPSGLREALWREPA